MSGDCTTEVTPLLAGNFYVWLGPGKVKERTSETDV
jgi:hypothetical protein